MDALKDVAIDETAKVKSKLNKVRKMDPYFEHISMNSKYQPRNHMNNTATGFMGREQENVSPLGIKSTHVDSD